MDTLGKTVRLVVIAATVLLPLGGCTKSPDQQFETYDHLKKPSGNASVDADTTEKADAKPPLTSTAPPVAVTSKTAEGTKPSVAVTQATASVPVPNAKQPDQVTNPSAAKNSTASSAAAKPATANPPATKETPSKLGVVTPVSQSTLANSSSARKVQLLVPNRDFKPEGQDGAVRVSYDDIDLLKVLNMDPVPPDAATKMPAWLKHLDGRRIRIRGFMYPTFQQTGVHAFGLARDNQICCFGRSPKIYDVFDVLLRDGVTTNYIPNRPFDVVGVFHIRPEAEDGKLFRLYEMDDATVVNK